MIAEIAPWETFAGMATTAVVAAVVAIWQGRKTRHVNSSEHADSVRHLLGLHRKVDGVRETVDRHDDRLDSIDKRLTDHLNEGETREQLDS